MNLKTQQRILEQGARSERAKIVAWLIELSSRANAKAAADRSPAGAGSVLDNIAQAINRGDHQK